MIKTIFKFFIFLFLIKFINCQKDKDLNFPFPNLLGEFDSGYSYFPMIDNLKLHIRCYTNKQISKNDGENLLFDSGLPLFSTAYGNVIEMLLKNNTMNKLKISNACFFDRYGYGWSELSPVALNSKQFIKKLYASIQTIPSINNSKYYYVGWSYGGLLGQTFATLYPNLIKGLLLIDSSDIGSLYDPKWSFDNITSQIDFILQSVVPSPKEYIEQLTDFGIITLKQGWMDSNTSLPKSCVEKTQKIILNSYDNYYLAAAQELSQFIPNAMFLKSQYEKIPCKPLGKLPLVVISSNPVEEPDWYNRQIEITKLSSNSIQLNSTDHFVPINQPDLIIKSIEILLNKN
ncbi:hypothetical protein DICPUDRAFT_149628 [Dictyostelium purpureum]|uniref:AB hydrolase-1 domain-containing protein n=1 Tax=Dictyostelium purpureum TaxID=5786 RepID=F0ZE91_DICPU|nr:uncharacterized protein DICPUDRAFT_149628 [Dictyostelium purpureum]EGC37732.1 hypothetical protein DICPUDRAFT_149628 [Dictyostelium purpureum]|eukprot:XP_003285753.1 hypothetical protein DICPUDRAFT_149628 [Dictyostelium purpureum]